MRGHSPHYSDESCNTVQPDIRHDLKYYKSTHPQFGKTIPSGQSNSHNMYPVFSKICRPRHRVQR
ncbi:Uncharacterised protein [Serratia quinivorans]|nr:Uncharacterised protein [Serratia quinivorans]